jgi:riboflavin kinase/FMN adenylyltransferase
MKLVHSLPELASVGARCCLAIGTFDGVHLGHQQVIRQSVMNARQHGAQAVVITFDAHPATIVAPDRVPPMICSLAQKLRAIESLGVDATLLLAFDRAFSQQPAEPFIRSLVAACGHVHSICVGARFTFGHRRSGDVELLRRLGAELGFAVHGLASVALDGEPVSSTRIRESIRAGNLDAAAQMLGRAYALAAPVVRGDQVGRKIGFPTANLDVTGRAIPPNGVYAALARHGEKTFPVALNIGTRPTLNANTPQLRVEAHLLGFSGELYGEELEITFVEKIRDELRFPNLDALKSQIARDINRVKAILS